MSRYTDNKCKLCRREGMKLFLKGQRCFTEKCAVSRRDYPPGVHAQKRAKVTEYGVRLREKQKLKRIYGVGEKQFKLYFHEAERLSGNTGENLMMLLERRLDNVILASGFALSRNHARQMITHGHFRVNGRKVDVPSFLVKRGDVATVRERSRKVTRIQEALELAQRRGVPEWLEVNPETFTGTVKAFPARTDLTMPINEKLVVELYSK